MKKILFLSKRKKNLLLNPYVGIIVFIYVLSRLYFYFILKLEFSYHLKEYLIQYLDITLLKSNLFESILYLHSQPPLFNFLIGAFEILFGDYSLFVFFVLFQIIGLMTVVLGFRILEFIEVNKKVSFILIIFYALSPATIVYENLFYYTHPIISFLIFSCYQLLVFIKSEKPINIFLFFVGLWFAVFTTSFFHISWFLLILLSLLFVLKSKRKTILKASALPLILIFALYFKNYLVFDQFNSSSWIGLNLSRITVHQLDKNLKQKLVESKQLSELTNLAPFTHYSDLNSAGIKYFNKKTGVEILDQTIKSSNRTNFNNIGYLWISKQVLKDDLYVIQNYPGAYLAGITRAFALYFDSPTKYKLLTSNIYKFRTYDKFFSAFVYGSSSNTKTGYTTIFLIVLILSASFYLLIKLNNNLSIKIFLLFALINVLYVMFVGNTLEFGENNRFRYYSEIFYILLLGLVINELFIKPLFNKEKQKNL